MDSSVTIVCRLIKFETCILEIRMEGSHIGHAGHIGLFYVEIHEEKNVPKVTCF